jgi:hypothetical protein
MINDALLFLKDNLNSYILGGIEPSNVADELPVGFPSNGQSDSIKLASDAITLLLINTEQENILRAANPHVRTMPDGVQQAVNPDIRLNLYILFVAYYNKYDAALQGISRIIEYFQRNRIFNHQNNSKLSDKIEQLVIELVTLPFAEQNEIWSFLRIAYQPSVIYKVKMIVFQDIDSISGSEIRGIETTIRDKSQ